MQNQTNQSQPQSSGREYKSEGSTKLADKAEHAAEQVKNAAIERMQSARAQARSEIEHSRSDVANRIRNVGSALRTAGDSLRDEDEMVARYVDMVSERIEGVASYVGSADPRTLMRDVETLARQRPAWFFGGAFLIGLAAGRFLKASGESREPGMTELEDADLEDVLAQSPSYKAGAYGRQQAYAQRAYREQPITPAATIPVTQGAPEGTSSAGAVRPPAPSTGAQGAGLSTGAGSAGASTPKAPKTSEQVERSNPIFDANVPGAGTGGNRP